MRSHQKHVAIPFAVVPKALALYLGHANPAFTLRVYTHLMEASEERTRQAIDVAFRAIHPEADGPRGGLMGYQCRSAAITLAGPGVQADSSATIGRRARGPQRWFTEERGDGHVLAAGQSALLGRLFD